MSPCTILWKLFYYLFILHKMDGFQRADLRTSDYNSERKQPNSFANLFFLLSDGKCEL